VTTIEREAVRQLRDLTIRHELLERKNVRLHALLKAAHTRRRKAADEAAFLHGLLLANGIEVPE